jgi:hypothetical protein
MQKGTKPALPSAKIARGTFKPYRDSNYVQVIEPDALPSQPDWLTEAGSAVWLDDIGRVSSVRLANERDSTMFATYCNLQGAIVQAWRAGEVPPAAHLMEARKMAEQFGLFGAKSRLTKAAEPGKPSGNPFTKTR